MRGKYLASNKRKKRSPVGFWVWMLLAGVIIVLSVLLLHRFIPADTMKETVPTLSITEHETMGLTISEPVQTESPVQLSTEAVEPAEPVETEALVDSVAQQARDILASMTLEEKIFQLFIVTQDQITGVSPVTQSGETSRSAIENYPVGGIIYFASNLVSREQSISMISNLQSYSKLGLFIAVDEEGGIVSRLGQNPDMGTTEFPDMGVIGESGDVQKAYQVGYTIGSDISALGFNLDFAPVADVNSNPNNPVIGSRAFHSDPLIAAELVAGCVEGFSDSGVLCTLKHFPGHGDTSTDSHYGAAEITKNLDELMECELLPFISGIEAGALCVMVGHITVPNVTDEAVPATLSYDIVTGLLRDTLCFDGLIITDAMQMQAITDQYYSGTAAVKALQAGVDIILMPQSLSDAVAGISEAVSSGELTEERIDESVLRILEVKLRSNIIPGMSMDAS